MQTLHYFAIAIQIINGTPTIIPSPESMPLVTCIQELDRVRPTFVAKGNLVGLGCVTKESLAAMRRAMGL